MLLVLHLHLHLHLHYLRTRSLFDSFASLSLVSRAFSRPTTILSLRSSYTLQHLSCARPSLPPHALAIRFIRFNLINPALLTTSARARLIRYYLHTRRVRRRRRGVGAEINSFNPFASNCLILLASNASLHASIASLLASQFLFLLRARPSLPPHALAIRFIRFNLINPALLTTSARARFIRFASLSQLQHL